MKKFLIYFSGLFLCVILFALACDKANMWLIHNSSGNGISKMERLWQMSHRDEVPILGSSRALGNYVPSLIADNCFNYGVNGMGMDELLFNLKAIRETNSPHPVILNIDPWATLSENKSSWVGDYRLAPQSGRRGGGDSIPGIRFHGMLRKNVTDYLNVKKSGTKVVDNGAVLLKNSRSEKEWSVINSRIIHHRFDLIKGIDEFENALSSMRPRRVIIVICPCSSRWTELYESRLELQSFCDRIDKLPNVDVVNMFGSDDFTDADFVDPTHFNIDGARKFTIRLMSEIKL